MAEASAPASSANLGAGFDTLALAIELRCRVAAAPSNDWQIEHVGEHRPLTGSQDAVLAAARLAVGPEHPMHLTVDNDIPVGRGLGSSAAAYAAGALAAWRTTGVEPTPDRLFCLVADLEGHSDNAAAAVFGGLQTVDVAGGNHRLALHPDLYPVLAVPEVMLFTNDARAALPTSFSRDVVVRSVQRAVALVEGLRTGEPALLAAAGGDEIHEGPRSKLNPIAADLIEAAQNAGAGFACWSGAGPSVLAMVTATGRGEVVAAMELALGSRGVILTPEIATAGIE